MSVPCWGLEVLNHAGVSMRLVVVVADSLRADICGCYGGPAATPELDGLASQGARVLRTYSSAPWTLPSLAAMLTGHWGHEVGLVHWLQQWPARPESVFGRFVRAGFKVNSFVFDTRYLFTGLPQAGVRGSSQDVEKLMAELSAVFREGGDSLTFVHYWGTHVPYVSGAMDVGMWKKLADGIVEVLGSRPELREKVKGVYRLGVERFSQQWLPRLLEVLEWEHRREETVLLITADHGESWGERMKPGQRVRGVFDLHGNHVHEEALRVPLVVAGGDVARGVEIGGMARTVDLAATLLDLAGVGSLADGRMGAGVSLAGVLRQGGAAGGGEAVAAVNRSAVELAVLGDVKPAVTDVWTQFARVFGGRKWVMRTAEGEGVAYDLENDPGEESPLVLEGEEREAARRWLAGEVKRARSGYLPGAAFREAEAAMKQAKASVVRSDVTAY